MTAEPASDSVMPVHTGTPGECLHEQLSLCFASFPGIRWRDGDSGAVGGTWGGQTEVCGLRARAGGQSTLYTLNIYHFICHSCLSRAENVQIRKPKMHPSFTFDNYQHFARLVMSGIVLCQYCKGFGLSFHFFLVFNLTARGLS